MGSVKYDIILYSGRVVSLYLHTFPIQLSYFLDPIPNSVFMQKVLFQNLNALPFLYFCPHAEFPYHFISSSSREGFSFPPLVVSEGKWTW